MNFHELTTSQWQNFVYLTLLLVMLLSSFVLRKNAPIGKALKYIGIWSAIIFVIISLYSYRYEFSDFKDRVLGEINPSQARVNGDGKIVVNISEDGHFYINLKVNGVAMLFMVDTGASSISIDVNDAKRIGIDASKLEFNQIFQTANGTGYGAATLIDEIEVGNIRMRNLKASINRAPMETPLLGMSFLRKFRKYEFYQDRLELTI